MSMATRKGITRPALLQRVERSTRKPSPKQSCEQKFRSFAALYPRQLAKDVEPPPQHPIHLQFASPGSPLRLTPPTGTLPVPSTHLFFPSFDPHHPPMYRPTSYYSQSTST
jgi:hypothetical protein